MYCSNCGKEIDDKAAICVHCGVVTNAQTTLSGSKDRVIAGLLAIFLGWLGVHKFYLGYHKEGVIMLIIAFFTLGSVSAIMSLIEGIIYLTKSPWEFNQIYVIGHKSWF